MLVGIDINEVCEYVSESDPDKNNPTRFLIGNIPNSKKISLFAGTFDSSGKPDMEKLQNMAIPIMKVGLKGIKNLNGKDIDKITDEAIESIPLVVLTEVFNKIIEFNFVGKEQEKN